MVRKSRPPTQPCLIGRRQGRSPPPGSLISQGFRGFTLCQRGKRKGRRERYTVRDDLARPKGLEPPTFRTGSRDIYHLNPLCHNYYRTSEFYFPPLFPPVPSRRPMLWWRVVWSLWVYIFAVVWMSAWPISSLATLMGTPAFCRSLQKVCRRQ